MYDPEDKILFDEAIKHVSGQAYRAAFITIWIATAESLRSKIHELSVRDSGAGKEWKEIQRLERQNFSPDKVILERSFSLGFLNENEYRKLEHAREMRNLYAHGGAWDNDYSLHFVNANNGDIRFDWDNHRMAIPSKGGHHADSNAAVKAHGDQSFVVPKN